MSSRWPWRDWGLGDDGPRLELARQALGGGVSCTDRCWVCEWYHHRLTPLVHVIDNDGKRWSYCPRCQPDLARAFGATTARRALALHRAHPTWTAAQVGEAVGVCRQRVCRIYAAAGITMRRGPLPRQGKVAA